MDFFFWWNDDKISSTTLSRGKLHLKLRVTIFLPEWQPPLIFVRFISNFLWLVLMWFWSKSNKKWHPTILRIEYLQDSVKHFKFFILWPGHGTKMRWGQMVEQPAWQQFGDELLQKKGPLKRDANWLSHWNLPS